jgi:hypothetical protein
MCSRPTAACRRACVNVCVCVRVCVCRSVPRRTPSKPRSSSGMCVVSWCVDSAYLVLCVRACMCVLDSPCVRVSVCICVCVTLCVVSISKLSFFRSNLWLALSMVHYMACCMAQARVAGQRVVLCVRACLRSLLHGQVSWPVVGHALYRPVYIAAGSLLL